MSYLKKQEDNLLEIVNFKNQDKCCYMQKISITLERFTLLGRRKVTYEMMPIGKEIKHQFWIISSKIEKNKRVYDNRFDPKVLYDIIPKSNLEIVIEYDEGEEKRTKVSKSDKLKIEYVTMQLKNLLK